MKRKNLKVGIRTNKLRNAILKAIDTICEEENYTLTYTEINNALITVLRDNNFRELEELIESDELNEN